MKINSWGQKRWGEEWAMGLRSGASGMEECEGALGPGKIRIKALVKTIIGL